MLIVIEGCIGAGKTTVANGLAKFRGSSLLLEAFAENPFLTDFYENPKANAIETEFSFLLLHFHQLKAKGQQLETEVIADFHLGKDMLYARQNLQNRRMLQLFQELYQELEQQIAQPSLMICLSASTELLVQRIQRRKREFEVKIDPEYYVRINEEYEHFFSKYEGQKIQISMDEFDFVKQPELYEELSRKLDQQLRLK